MAECRLAADRPAIRTAAGDCLALARAHTAGPGRPLVVFLHGDSGGVIRAASWERHVARVAGWGAAADATSLVMVRPGYATPAGRSDGTAKPTDDDYTAANMRLVAEALTALRQELRPSRLILVGHSGGAATTALVGALHPGSADALVVVACPCTDINEWRAWRNISAGRRGTWTESLSPGAYSARTPASVRVVALTGAADTNTLPRYGRDYVLSVRSGGASATFVEVPGADHTSILSSPAITEAIVRLAREP
jgi:pimeloyl-ACP methyl ester carboxylesterase